MGTLQAALAHGDYLDASRIKAYCGLLLVGFASAFAVLLATADGLVDWFGRPLGTDFANVWTAGRMALAGTPEAVYDPALHHAEQQAFFGSPEIPFYGWHYPPFFLIVAAALAAIPYLPALLAWQAATLACYVGAIRLIAPGPLFLLAALAFPAVFVNLTHGQNGFLTAALIGAGMVLLDRRPWLAGILIGLLAYKPQFGLLVPLVLIATWRWKPFVSAAVTVLAMAAAATALFGPGIWRAFLSSAGFTSTVVLEAGSTGWQRIHSVFAVARALGAPVEAAYLLHGIVAIALAAGVLALWRSKADQRLQAAGLIAACILITPYALDYDLMALAPALAFLVLHGLDHGFRPWQKSLLLFAWAAPLFSRQAAAVLYVHPGLVGAFLVLAIALSRAATDRREQADDERRQDRGAASHHLEPAGQA